MLYYVGSGILALWFILLVLRKGPTIHTLIFAGLTLIIVQWVANRRAARG